MTGRKALPLVLAALAAGLAVPAVPAQSLPGGFAVLPEEAPESLVALELGDASVDLTISGFWEARVLLSGRAAFDPDSGLVFSAPPPLLVQTPDLWLSLLIEERWFLEARADASGEMDEFAGGYRGASGDFLKEVRVGNTGIGVPAFPWLPMGPASPGLFGLAMRASDGDAESRRPDTVRLFAAARYEQSGRVVQRYRGEREELETRLAASAYIRDRFFILPSTGIANAAFYIESAAGTLGGSDGVAYRRLGADEYALDATRGLLELKAQAKGRLLASWTGGADDPMLENGTPLSVDGGSAILLFDPEGDDGAGVPGSSPVHYFQSLGRYEIPTDYRDASLWLDVLDATSGLPDPDFELLAAADGASAELLPSGALDPRASARTRPFGGGGPLVQSMDWLYERDALDSDSGGAAPVATRAPRLRRLGAPGSFSLREGFVPGSVELTRNGASELDFSIEGGALRLGRPAALSDEIVISYLVASAERRDGALTAAAGAEFLGEPGRAWLAAGARWGLPGLGYSESGSSSPALLSLVGGLEGAVPGPGGYGELSATVAGAALWRNADASGLYRASGMDEDSDWDSPYRLTADPAAGATLSAVDDDGIAADFPTLAARLDPPGVPERALEFAFSGGDGTLTVAERTVDPVPIGDYGRLAFWYRADEILETGSPLLSLVLLSGTAEAARIDVPLPGAGGSQPWTRIEVDLDAGLAPTVYAVSSEGEARAALAGASAALDRGLEPGLIRFEVEGVQSGTVRVDNVILEAPESGYALRARGRLAYAAPGAIPGFGLASEPALSLEGSGELTLSPEGSAYGTRSLGAASAVSLGFARLSGDAKGFVSVDGDGAARSGAAFGHGLILGNSGPLRLEERFSHDPYADRLSRKDSAGLALGAFALSAEASASLLGEAFAQDWKALLALGPLSLEASAALAAPEAPFSPSAAYGEAWLESWPLLLPASEADASRRSLQASLAIKPEGALIAAQVSATARPPAAAIDYAASWRLSRRFSLGERMSLEPAYARAATSTLSYAGASMLADLEVLGAAIPDSPWLYDAVPFAELFDPALAERFGASTAGAANAAYAPELSLSFARRYGSRVSDLLLPSEARLALRRKLSRAADSTADVFEAELSGASAAIDLFGARGSRPLADWFDSDEYASRASLLLRFPAGEAAPSLVASQSLLATLLGPRSEEWRFEERSGVDRDRDGTTWFASFEARSSLRPERTWLSDLAAWGLGDAKREAGAPPEPGRADGAPAGTASAAGGSAEPGSAESGSAGASGGQPEGRADAASVSVVSEYLDLVRAAPRAATSTLILKLACESPERAGDQLRLSLRETWLERVVARERLVLETSLGLVQGLSVEDGRTLPFADFEASLGLKVIF